MLKISKIICLCFFWSNPILYGQERTVGTIINSAGALDGYLLLAPMASNRTFLVNNDGEVVHEWVSKYIIGLSAQIDDDGNLYRLGQDPNPPILIPGGGGILQKLNWDGQVLWEFKYSNTRVRQHHDFKLMPNGHVLLTAWDAIPREEAIEEGRDSSFAKYVLLAEHIIEIDPAKQNEIVWRWDVIDHVIQDKYPDKKNYGSVEDHPELININYYINTLGDWIHTNSIDFNAQRDEILLSARNFNEIWIIDHSTSTEEAAGHVGGRSGKGGDLIFRWGNPQIYNQGDSLDQVFYSQHHATWILGNESKNDQIMVFNNGFKRPSGTYSSIDILSPDLDDEGHYFQNDRKLFGPNSLDYTYTAKEKNTFYSIRFSGAEWIDNGNLLICSGVNGTIFEVNSEEEIVWKYVNPLLQSGKSVRQGEEINGKLNQVFRSLKYPKNFSGFIDKEFLNIGKIEEQETILDIEPNVAKKYRKGITSPNPSNGLLLFDKNLDLSKVHNITVNDLSGKVALILSTYGFSGELDLSELKNGIYILSIKYENLFINERVIIKK